MIAATAPSSSAPATARYPARSIIGLRRPRSKQFSVQSSASPAAVKIEHQPLIVRFGAVMVMRRDAKAVEAQQLGVAPVDIGPHLDAKPFVARNVVAVAHGKGDRPSLNPRLVLGHD